MIYKWRGSETLNSKKYKCGHCGEPIASQLGYVAIYNNTVMAYLYICHHCSLPTLFEEDGHQTPGVSFGEAINHIPDKNVEKLFNEARSCFKINAYTSCVMCCRKLLMNISVSEGQGEGKTFAEYVDYLNSNGFIPPKGKAWVDKIRKIGNEANHKIEFKSNEDAQLILTFTTMLLKFIYEMPGMLGISETQIDK